MSGARNVASSVSWSDMAQAGSQPDSRLSHSREWGWVGSSVKKLFNDVFGSRALSHKRGAYDTCRPTLARLDHRCRHRERRALGPCCGVARATRRADVVCRALPGTSVSRWIYKVRPFDFVRMWAKLCSEKP